MKLFYQFAYQLIRIYWRIFRPITAGVRVLLVENRSVILVKHTYEDAWYLPGGGLKRGETLADAARRETAEEVNGQLQDLRLFGIYTNFSQLKTDHIVLFISEDFTWQAKADKAEIEAIGQFSFDRLPANLSRGTKRRLDEYLANAPVQAGTW